MTTAEVGQVRSVCRLLRVTLQRALCSEQRDAGLHEKTWDVLHCEGKKDSGVRGAR